MLDRSLFGSVNKRLELLTPKTLHSRYLCGECKDILIQPYQTNCGFRYCLNCIKKLDAKSKCPGCKENITVLDSIFTRDRAMDREISKLQLACINENCKDITFFKDFENHLKVCKYRTEKCKNCDEYYVVNEEKYHLEEKCPNQLITCRLCQIQLTRYTFETVHNNLNSNTFDDLCEFLEGNCPYNCCDTSFKRIKSHLQSCTRRPVNCIMWMVGCQKVVCEQNMNDHIKEDGETHLELLMKCLLERRQESIDMISSISQNQKSTISNIEQLKLSSLSLNETSRNLLKNTKQNQNSRSDLQSIKSGNTISSVSIGEIVWTVSDIIKKIENAKQNIETEIMSDAFYTDIPGYKMRLKIYPNGDGKSKNHFLSVFFVILKGEYDDQISWPFSKRITISVVKDEIPIDSTLLVMRPNLNQACYGKPNTEFNVGSGEPAFIKISDLIFSTNFTSNSNLTIKFKVDR